MSPTSHTAALAPAEQTALIRKGVAGHPVSVFARNERALWTTIDGRAVVLHPDRGRYYETNALGAVIWALLEQPRSMSEVVDEVVARYRVGREQCERDVRVFVDRLRESDLIAELDSPPHPHTQAAAPDR